MMSVFLFLKRAALANTRVPEASPDEENRHKVQKRRGKKVNIVVR